MAKSDNRTGSLGFESRLWDAADLLRSNMDPAEYKHVVLGLIFLKYIEDAFEARKAVLTGMVCEPEGEYYVEGHEAQQLELTELLEDRGVCLRKRLLGAAGGALEPYPRPCQATGHR